MFNGDKVALPKKIDDWAGGLPERQSVMHALDAVETYAGQARHWDSQRDELERSMVALLTDLHHLAFVAGFDFGNMTALAERTYEQS